jgi:hypothetical protein
LHLSKFLESSADNVGEIMSQWTLQCQNQYEISLTLKLALDLMTVFSSETGLDRFRVTFKRERSLLMAGVAPKRNVLLSKTCADPTGKSKLFLPNFKHQLKNKYPHLAKNFTK